MIAFPQESLRFTACRTGHQDAGDIKGANPCWIRRVRLADRQAVHMRPALVVASYRSALKIADRALDGALAGSPLTGDRLPEVEMLLVSCRKLSRAYGGWGKIEDAVSSARRPFEFLLRLVCSDELPQPVRGVLLRYLLVALMDYEACLNALHQEDDLARGMFDCARDSVFLGALRGRLRGRAPSSRNAGAAVPRSSPFAPIGKCA